MAQEAWPTEVLARAGRDGVDETGTTSGPGPVAGRTDAGDGVGKGAPSSSSVLEELIHAGVCAAAMAPGRWTRSWRRGAFAAVRGACAGRGGAGEDGAVGEWSLGSGSGG